MRATFALAMVCIASVTFAEPLPQKRQAPIDIQCAVPPDLKAGAEVTTKVVVSPEVDVDRVEVDLSTDGALVIVEQPNRRAFPKVKAGQQVTLDVKLRLTGDMGRLVVQATIFSGEAQQSRVLAFIFRASKAAAGPAN